MLAPAVQTGKVLIAGGSCLHALTKGVHGGEGAWGPTSDVDIFLHSCALRPMISHDLLCSTASSSDLP